MVLIVSLLELVADGRNSIVVRDLLIWGPIRRVNRRTILLVLLNTPTL